MSGPLQFGALAALRECLAAAEPVVLARYAAAVFSALEGALEAEATDPRLLPPLLAALIQVSLKMDCCRETSEVWHACAGSPSI